MTEEIDTKDSKPLNKCPLPCQETDISDDEAETSIKTFSNSISPKFIRSLENTNISLKKKNFGCYVNKSASMEIGESQEVVPAKKCISPGQRNRKRLDEQKLVHHSISSSSSEENEDELRETELKNNVPDSKELRKLNSKKMDSLKPRAERSTLHKPLSRLTSLSNVVSNIDEFEHEALDSSSNMDFSLRSLNEATLSQFFNPTFTEESLENQIFPSNMSPRKDQFTSLILLPDGKMKKVDKRDILEETTGSGILKFRNEKVRRKTKHLLQKIEEDEPVERNKEKKTSGVSFGKMMKIYHFNPKKKVAIKRNNTKFVKSTKNSR